MPSPKLSQRQARFVEAVLGGPRGRGRAPGVIGGGRLSADQALDVYRRGYRARLTEALGETYEAVWWTLGDEAFFKHCKAFIARNPSPFYNLSDYGAGFPAFLRRLPETRALPFLPELAAFEWTFKELFHQAEETGLPAGELAGLGDPGALRFHFVGSARLLSHRRAVHAVWERRASGEPLPASLWNRPERLLLYKNEVEIRWAALGEGEFALLRELFRGRTLSQAFSSALKKHPELDEERVSAVFGLIGGAGIVKAVSARKTPEPERERSRTPRRKSAG